MLRWIAASAVLCVLFAAIGLDKIVQLPASTESFFLAMAALAGTVLFSSYDAWETQVASGDQDD